MSNKPILSRRKRIGLITVLIIVFSIVSPPENITELIVISSLVFSVSYDSWWSGIEADRQKSS